MTSAGRLLRLEPLQRLTDALRHLVRLLLQVRQVDMQLIVVQSVCARMQHQLDAPAKGNTSIAIGEGSYLWFG